MHNIIHVIVFGCSLGSLCRTVLYAQDSRTFAAWRGGKTGRKNTWFPLTTGPGGWVCNTIKCAYICIHLSIYRAACSRKWHYRPDGGQTKDRHECRDNAVHKNDFTFRSGPVVVIKNVYVSHPSPDDPVRRAAIEIAADQGADVFTSDKLSSSYIQYKTHLKTRLFEGYFIRAYRPYTNTDIYGVFIGIRSK